MVSLTFDPDDEFIWNQRFPHASNVDSIGCIGDCTIAKYPKFYIKVYSGNNGLFPTEIWEYDRSDMIMAGNLNESKLNSFGRRLYKDDDSSTVSKMLTELMVSDRADPYCNY